MCKVLAGCTVLARLHMRSSPLSPIRPSNRLQFQELLQPRAPIEPSPPAHLHAPVRQIWLVMDGHAVDMYGTNDLVSASLAHSSRTPPVARATYPDSICLATFNPLAKSSVKTAALSPYSVSFANFTASSSLSTTNKLTLGPKLSV